MADQRRPSLPPARPRPSRTVWLAGAGLLGLAGIQLASSLYRLAAEAWRVVF